MKPIVIPVSRPTANCIRSSFRNSGKRHLILTGSVGCGKSTLLSQLFPEKLPGITTRAEPQKAVFLQDNQTAETVQIGIYDPKAPGTRNKMVLLDDGFTSLGIPILDRCTEGASPWVTVDEIGYLETNCPAYLHRLRLLFEKKQVAAVVRKQNLPFLSELLSRDDAFVVDLDDPFGNMGCVIMASGLGKRFGGNKLMADFHGSPLICPILDATEGIFRQRVVVTRHPAVARLCEERGIDTILHEEPSRNDTIRLGMEAVREADRCMFTPADQPLLRWETVAALALASKNDPNSIWRTCFDCTPGSPVVFPKWSFHELASLPEGKGGNVIIKKHPERLKMLSCRDPNELRDVDTQDDLLELSMKSSTLSDTSVY